MYRAKVEAISGIKIFAGGKWLQCIGNKNVNVGDYIWTDGRCVYGHNQQPQQPLVITSPNEEEAIPIIVDGKTYTFDKCKLVYLNTLYKDNPQNDIDDRIMVNSENGKVILYHTDDELYWDLSHNTTQGNIHILAANIDKFGNEFKMILQDLGAIIHWGERRFGYDYAIDEDSYDYSDIIYVKLFKNNELFKTISLNKYFLKIKNSLPTSHYVEDGDKVEPWLYFSFSICNTFIENETTWHFCINIQAQKYFYHFFLMPPPQVFYIFHPDPDADYLIFRRILDGNHVYGSEQLLTEITSKPVEITYHEWLPDEPSVDNKSVVITAGVNVYSLEHNLAAMAVTALGLYSEPWEDVYYDDPKEEIHTQETTFYVQSDEEYILHTEKKITYRSREYLVYDPFPRYIPLVHTHEYPDAEKAKIHLDYGCYYTITQCTDPNAEQSVAHNITLFNRNGTKIVSFICDIRHKLLIAKIKDSYLLSIAPLFIPEKNGSLNVLDDLFQEGIYLFKNGEWEKIIEGYCINQRLRPMKKYRKWHKRIREIHWEQLEI